VKWPTVRSRSEWSEAGSLAELGELTALWLEGAIDDHPGIVVEPGEEPGPDPETRPLVPVLAAINRAGLVTDFSQPGHPDDDGWIQRAAVAGYCDDKTRARLVDVLGRTELLVLAEHPDSDSALRIPVTIADGEMCTWVGGALDDEYLQLCYRGVPQAGLDALRESWYVTVLDPVWERADRLWPALLDALGAPEATN